LLTEARRSPSPGQLWFTVVDGRVDEVGGAVAAWPGLLPGLPVDALPLPLRALLRAREPEAGLVQGPAGHSFLCGVVPSATGPRAELQALPPSAVEALRLPQLALDALPVRVVVRGPDGALLLVNAAAAAQPEALDRVGADGAPGGQVLARGPSGVGLRVAFSVDPPGRASPWGPGQESAGGAGPSPGGAEARAALRRAVMASGIPVCLCDEDGLVLLCAPELAELLRVPPEELEGRPAPGAVGGEGARAVRGPRGARWSLLAPRGAPAEPAAGRLGPALDALAEALSVFISDPDPTADLAGRLRALRPAPPGPARVRPLLEQAAARLGAAGPPALGGELDDADLSLPAAALTAALDELGRVVRALPGPPPGLRAELRAGPRLRVELLLGPDRPPFGPDLLRPRLPPAAALPWALAALGAARAGLELSARPGPTLRLELPVARPEPTPAPPLLGRRALVAAADGAWRARLAARLQRWGAVVEQRDAGPAALEAMLVGGARGTPPVEVIVDEAIGAAFGDALRRAAVGSLAGTRVWVLVDADAPAPEAAGAPPGPIGGGPEGAGLARALGSPGAARRVLLAEDNPVNQQVARLMLEAAGCEVVTAGDGRAAVDAAGRERFDLVLMDIQMPVLDGIEAARQIRSLPAPRGAVPIVALTANALPSWRAQCVAAGMDDFLVKPLDRAALLRVVEGLSAAAGPAEAPAPAAAPELDLPTLQELRETFGPALSRVFGSLERDAPARAARMAAHAAAGAWDELRREAHSLKSSTATFGLLGVAEDAQLIETACREGRGPSVAARAAALPERVSRALSRARAEVG